MIYYENTKNTLKKGKKKKSAQLLCVLYGSVLGPLWHRLKCKIYRLKCKLYRLKCTFYRLKCTFYRLKCKSYRLKCEK